MPCLNGNENEKKEIRNIKIEKIGNCEGGNLMRLPMNYKERYIAFVDISSTIFYSEFE